MCPAGFDLGQHRNITLLAVTEGDDKPAKYPVMFRAADLLLLSKCDLLPLLDDFDPARAEASLRALGCDTPDDSGRRAPYALHRSVARVATHGTIPTSKTGGRSSSQRCAMCLAIPAKVLAVQPDGWAEVDVGGVRSRVCLTLLDGVTVGDYVLIHAGFALTRLNVEEAEKTLALFAEIAAALNITANALPQRIP